MWHKCHPAFSMLKRTLYLCFIFATAHKCIWYMHIWHWSHAQAHSSLDSQGQMLVVLPAAEAQRGSNP